MLNKVFYSNTGSTEVEIALKTALTYFRRETDFPTGPTPSEKMATKTTF